MIYTVEERCSVSGCCCYWSCSAHSDAEARARTEAALAEQDAVRVTIGIVDADGNDVPQLFCRDCWSGLVEATRSRGAA